MCNILLIHKQELPINGIFLKHRAKCHYSNREGLPICGLIFQH